MPTPPAIVLGICLSPLLLLPFRVPGPTNSLRFDTPVRRRHAAPSQTFTSKRLGLSARWGTFRTWLPPLRLRFTSSSKEAIRFVALAKREKQSQIVW